MQEIVNLILVDGHVEKLTSFNRTIVIELADVKTLSPEVVAAAGPVLRQMKEAPSPRVLSTHVPFPLLPRQIQEKRPKVRRKINLSYLSFLGESYGKLYFVYSH